MKEQDFLIRYHSLNALVNKKVQFKKSAISSEDGFVEIDENGNPIDKLLIGRLLMVLGGVDELFIVVDCDGQLVYADVEKTPVMRVIDAPVLPVLDPPNSPAAI